MAVRSWKRTCRDAHGVEHSVEVTEQSLHEAVAPAWRIFGESERLLAHWGGPARRSLRDEIADSQAGSIDPEHVAALLYLDATVKEVLRIAPIFPFVLRRLTRSMRLGKSEFAAGTFVAPASTSCVIMRICGMSGNLLSTNSSANRLTIVLGVCRRLGTTQSNGSLKSLRVTKNSLCSIKISPYPDPFVRVSGKLGTCREVLSRISPQPRPLASVISSTAVDVAANEPPLPDEWRIYS